MPGADDLMMRVYAAMAQKKRELISERTRVALAAAKARGALLAGSGILAHSSGVRGSGSRLSDLTGLRFTALVSDYTMPGDCRP